jgi:hypothetical protein
MNDAPPIVREDDEAEEEPEGEGGDHEEVAGSRLRQVISKKGSPGLRWRPSASTTHIFAHGGVGDLVAEELQF